jgi:hypothetical protein
MRFCVLHALCVWPYHRGDAMCECDQSIHLACEWMRRNGTRALTKRGVEQRDMRRGYHVMHCNHNGPALVAALVWGAMVYLAGMLVLTLVG